MATRKNESLPYCVLSIGADDHSQQHACGVLLLPSSGSKPIAPHQVWHRHYIICSHFRRLQVNRTFFKDDFADNAKCAVPKKFASELTASYVSEKRIKTMTSRGGATPSSRTRSSRVKGVDPHLEGVLGGKKNYQIDRQPPLSPPLRCD